jgi:biotin carboxylase
MNIVFLSPHFPPNYYPFCVHLKRLGANVLGVAAEPYDNLHPELKDALTEYYRVDDLRNYDQLVRAFGYFTHQYGKIDHLDSQNEFWLETEARLRDDFNIRGLSFKQILDVKHKSRMKKIYQKAGIDVARGKIIRNLKDAKKFLADTGYPVVAKPDVGVGAAQTYKLIDDIQLERFFSEKPPVDYFMEEFIEGQIVSFDGMVNFNGDLVFSAAHKYSRGVMETVNQDTDIYYYSYREIPADLEEMGRRTLNAFNVRGRFFHFEYFLTSDDRLVALEVNMRPPGGLTTDMFNYANEIDVYAAWAELVVTGKTEVEAQRLYHVCYAGRKTGRQYLNSHDAVLAYCEDKLVHHQPISGIFAGAIGNYGYILRSPQLDDVIHLAEFIQATV